MSARRLLRRRILAVLACLPAIAGVLATGAVAARAEPPTLVSYGSFNSVTKPELLGVAVDNSTLASAGDVYAVGFFDTEAPPIDKFSASGQLLSPPSPFGETFGVSAAVNPTNGDLDVLSAFGGVTVYNPSTGEPTESFSVELAGEVFQLLFHPPQIATDSAGDVYVPDPYRQQEKSPGSGEYEYVANDEVHEYGPSGALLDTFTGEGTLKEPSGVAIDSAGDLWVADRHDNRIEELSAADHVIGEIKSKGVQTVALDGNDVLAIVQNEEDFCGSISPPCAHLVEYSATGAKLADVGAGSFEGGEASARLPSLVAVNEASGRVYVSDASHDVVWIYGAPTAPILGRELSAEVSTSEGKLGALINPGGIQTTYRFEYGTTTAYGDSIPFPEGSAGEGVVPHTVWAAASSLAPGTTYHYRVVATNELGTVAGPDQTFTTLTATQAACPNEEVRSGFSARLPDCRAYELVTPVTKTSVESREGGFPAANGEAVAFTVNDPLPNAPSGSDYYLAKRGAGGWSSESVIPLESYSQTTCGNDQRGPEFYSAELSSAIIQYGAYTRGSTSPKSLGTDACNAEGLQVTPGEPVGYQNLLLRNNATGAYRLINVPPAGVTPADAHFKGASADLSHVVFTERAPLAEGAIYGEENLYEWDEGALRVLSVLPNETPVVGASLPEAHGGANPISADGSHILFTYGGGLYDRIDGQRTVEVDESHGKGASGGGSFQTASADGQQVFFTDESRLTADSTAEAGEPDLYECDLPESASRCELHDLTVAKAGGHADVIRVSVLGSEESSRVYFTARGVLAANKREYTSSEGKTVVEEAEGGQNNLYVWDEGSITFVAALKSGSYEDYGLGQASPDGAWFAFQSYKSLTGYENSQSGGVPTEEVFVYGAASGQVACATCNPSGEAPSRGGANIADVSSAIAPRYLSNGGRLFFESSEALVPSDTNGQPDVYEYEGGHVYLISSGTSLQGSTFLDTGEGGRDVFFRSSQALVPQDDQEGMDAIYDARVGGGFAAPAASPACTTADACRVPVPPQPSVYGAPASQTFSGVGNLAPAAAKPKANEHRKKGKRSACRHVKRHRRAGCTASRRRHKHRKAKAQSHKGGK